MSEEIRKQRILIVDDAPENIRILAQALKSDYKTTFATAGDQAIKFAISEDPPDLILLDIMMPEMDGYEVCRRLKAEHKTKNIPVIFITAMNQEEDETKGLEIGAVDYITKPFSMAIVKARVRTHLELKRHRDILENLSSLDGLTAILNRRRFDEVLQTEWRHCQREGSPLSLVMIDIDYFKNFNDKRGHQAGDDCLKRVAKTLADSVRRPMDIVARYGGEEFAAILPKTDRDGSIFVAEIMRNNIEALNISHPDSSVSDYVTISLGSATVVPDNRLSSDILVKAADDALFQAKREGRNCVRGIDLN
jgi:diguanylate cyclase (GGDEF)-like protein